MPCGWRGHFPRCGFSRGGALLRDSTRDLQARLCQRVVCCRSRAVANVGSLLLVIRLEWRLGRQGMLEALSSDGRLHCDVLHHRCFFCAFMYWSLTDPCTKPSEVHWRDAGGCAALSCVHTPLNYFVQCMCPVGSWKIRSAGGFSISLALAVG